MSLHEHDCLSEIPIQLCLNKVNELDDKIVWTPALEPETDGRKKMKVVTYTSFISKGRDEGEGQGGRRREWGESSSQI